MDSEFMKTVAKEVAEKLRDIENFKERYIEAWIAETGVQPSECELIQQQGFQDENVWTRIFIRRKDGDNVIEKSQYRTIKCLEAENAKLREALTKISEFKNGPLDGIKLYSVTELAREALDGRDRQDDRVGDY